MPSVVTYRLVLQEPVLVAEETGDPNSAVALPYLPGSVLRGALIRRRGVQGIVDPAVDPDFRRLFLDGAVRFLNGYPVCEGVRALPVPFSWHRPKGDEDTIRDFVWDRPESEADEIWQGIGSSFWAFHGQGVIFQVPRRHVAAHNARSRRYGRARQGDGAVFRYDALAPQQTFEAAVLCDDPNDAQTICRLLKQSPNLRLGGSRTGGYGLACIETESVAVKDGWGEEDKHSKGQQPVSEWLTLTLLSDALVRDEHGQYADNAKDMVHAVEAQLKQPAGALRDEGAFLRVHIVGGFNQTWGLPLPQAQALKMGSVILLRGSLSASDRKRLQNDGIGERRAEGFGRVAVDWWFDEALTRVEPQDTAEPFAGGLPETEADARTEAAKIAKRLFERRLEERVEEAANGVANELTNPPSNAQISRLRDLLHDQLRRTTPNFQDIRNHLANVRSRASTNDQFRNSRVAGQRLDDWLAERLGWASTEDNWRSLKITSDDLRPVGGLMPDRDTLWEKAVLRYLDAVLARAAKQARSREEED